MKTILADIGGTHVRFAFAGDGQIDAPIKYKTAEYDGFLDVLKAYEAEVGKAGERIIPASAAWPNADGVYVFSNKTGWHFDPQELRDAGYILDYVLNDFEAASYGAVSLHKDELECLKTGRKGRDYARLICGPGTGLGLGVAAPFGEAEWMVQRSFGARMIAATYTQEQEEIKRAIFKNNGSQNIVEYEDMVSGRALVGLHDAVCDVYGHDKFGERAEHILEKQDVQSVQITLRLFHEFLGVFLHSALMFTHSYGGVYLCGGMMDRLKERGLLDWSSTETYMLMPLGAEYIEHVIADTPVYYMNDPFLALRGLQEFSDYER